MSSHIFFQKLLCYFRPPFCIKNFGNDENYFYLTNESRLSVTNNTCNLHLLCTYICVYDVDYEYVSYKYKRREAIRHEFLKLMALNPTKYLFLLIFAIHIFFNDVLFDKI